MFKNSVIKPNVDTLQWVKATAVRTIKTMAQAALASGIGSASVLTDVNWKLVVSATVLSGIACIITSIAGIPEVEAIDIHAEDLKDTEFNEVEDLDKGVDSDEI